MTDRTLEAIKKRLAVMTAGEEPYPCGEVFRAKVSAAMNDAVQLVVTDVGDVYDRAIGEDRTQLDTILADWVAGNLDDDATLTKLRPLSLRYRRGLMDSDTVSDGLSDPEDKLRQEFARDVMSAYFNVVEAAGDVGGRHMTEQEEECDRLDYGLTFDELLAKHGIKRGRGRDRCSTPSR